MKKKLLLGSICVSLVMSATMALTGCLPTADGKNNANGLNSANSVYGIGAVSTVSLLGSRTASAAVKSFMDANRAVKSAAADEVTPPSTETEVKSEAEKFNEYFTAIDSFLGEDVISTSTEANPDKESFPYETKMVINGRNFEGGVVTYTMYYTETLVGAPVTPAPAPAAPAAPASLSLGGSSVKSAAHHGGGYSGNGGIFGWGHDFEHGANHDINHNGYHAYHVNGLCNPNCPMYVPAPVVPAPAPAPDGNSDGASLSIGVPSSQSINFADGKNHGKNDDFDDEIKTRYTLVGVMVIDGASYYLEGGRVVETGRYETESELHIRAYADVNDNTSYVEMRQESELEGNENETEYVYSVYSAGQLVERTAVDFETEVKANKVETEYRIEFRTGEGRGLYKVKREVRDGVTSMKVQYSIDGKSGVFYIREIADPATGEKQYEYSYSDGARDCFDVEKGHKSGNNGNHKNF